MWNNLRHLVFVCGPTSCLQVNAISLKRSIRRKITNKKGVNVEKDNIILVKKLQQQLTLNDRQKQVCRRF